MEKNWTKIEAVDWLKKQLALGKHETPDEVDACGCMDYASGLEADVDPETKKLCGFTIEPVDLSERTQSFEIEMAWGMCSATGLPDGPLDWETEPQLSEEGYAGDLDQLELAFSLIAKKGVCIFRAQRRMSRASWSSSPSLKKFRVGKCVNSCSRIIAIAMIGPLRTISFRMTLPLILKFDRAMPLGRSRMIPEGPCEHSPLFIRHFPFVE